MPIQIFDDGPPTPFGECRRRNHFRADSDEHRDNLVDIIHRKADSRADCWRMLTEWVDLKNKTIHARCVMFWSIPVTMFREQETHLGIESGGSLDVR